MLLPFVVVVFVVAVVVAVVVVVVVAAAVYVTTLLLLLLLPLLLLLLFILELLLLLILVLLCYDNKIVLKRICFFGVSHLVRKVDHRIREKQICHAFRNHTDRIKIDFLVYLVLI